MSVMLSQCQTHILPLLAAAALIAQPSVRAQAADASPWDNDARSSARLVAAPARDGTKDVRRAGLEIKLLPGWKTYWRYPGDSGVPPVFDFAASDNVKAVTVLYPAPTKFDDGAGGTSIGYTGAIVFPLHVTAQDAAKPVTLKLSLKYAVCEKLCVPAQAEVALALDDTAGGQDAAIAAAEARVPRRAPLGAPGALSVRAVQREASASKPRVLVDVAAPAGVTLFAEGPAPDWALPVPEPVAGAPAGLQRFAFELDGLPPGAKAEGATLRLTAVAGEQAIEVEYRLD